MSVPVLRAGLVRIVRLLSMTAQVCPALEEASVKISTMDTGIESFFQIYAGF